MQEPETQIRETMLGEAQAAAARLVGQARAEAEALLAQAAAETKRERVAALAAAEAEGARLARAIAAGVAPESARRWLRRRETVISEALREAVCQAETLAGTERDVSLAELAAAAVAELGAVAAGAVFSVPPADAPRLTPAFLQAAAAQAGQAAAATWQVRPVPGMASGLIVTSADGRLRIDQTYAARRHRLQSSLRRAAVAALGDGNEGDSPA